MGQRLSLSQLLRSILGSTNVYFQPPPTKNLDYPCIVYRRNDMKSEFADDLPYNIRIQYQIVVIDENPDSLIPEKILLLPMCKFERHYTKDNLNHDVFNIYY